MYFEVLGWNLTSRPFSYGHDSSPGQRINKYRFIEAFHTENTLKWHPITNKPLECSLYTTVDVHLLNSSSISTVEKCQLTVVRVAGTCNAVDCNGRFERTCGLPLQVWMNQFLSNTVRTSMFISKSQYCCISATSRQRKYRRFCSKGDGARSSE
jgi:hypothetical protein